MNTSVGKGQSRPALLVFSGMVALVMLALADPVDVRFTEGVEHGFLALRTLDGKTIADGETTQMVRGRRVTEHLVYRFRDGSLYDDTTVFSQAGTFRLISDRLVEQGPAFPQPMDTFVDAANGNVTVRYKDKNGSDKVETESIDVKPDLANGFVLQLLKNIRAGVTETKASMVVATPKPRLIGLEIRPEGEEHVAVGRLTAKAMRYVVKIKIGGVAGVVAQVAGKQPADTHVWILVGGIPAFLKSEGPLFEGGPIWRTVPVNPTFADRKESR
jgi:hypothetical protein